MVILSNIHRFMNQNYPVEYSNQNYLFIKCQQYNNQLSNFKTLSIIYDNKITSNNKHLDKILKVGYDKSSTLIP